MRNNIVTDLENSRPDFDNFINTVNAKNDQLRHLIKKRHASKYDRDHIDVTKSQKSKKGRRYDKRKRISRYRNKREKRKVAIQQRKQEAISKTPDQNAINLSNVALSQGQISLFIPSLNDTN